jgi:hypothetical protein
VETFWESFRLDPRQPKYAPMRASDADRDAVRAVLADAYTDGRLTHEEYDVRLGTLYDSRTLGELPALVADLVLADDPPAPLPSGADFRVQGARKWRKDVEEAVGSFLIPAIICSVIWGAIGGGFFWPAIPMLILGLNLVKTVVQRESVIEAEVLRLKKQQAKAELQDSAAARDDPDENPNT